MVSAGICFGRKETLHFIPDKTEVNAKLYVETLLPKLVQECRSVLPSDFIFQQDTIKLAQERIATNCSEFIGKDEWPPNLPDLNPLDYYVWGAMLECYKSFQPKPTNVLSAQESSAVDMGLTATGLDQQSHIELPKKTWACVKAGGGHFEHMLK